VREVLGLEPCRHGGPRVVAGERGLDRAVRWVHSSEVPDIATLLRGGELVLTTGIGLPEDNEALRAFVATLAEVGAAGLIVHGGHLPKNDDPAVGFDNWRKCAERTDFKLPVFIENTAGGTNAMARELDSLARLWDAVGDYGLGFCLDTCHAHAGGIDLTDVVETVRAITGRIDLVHANDSRDEFGSGADRHTNLGDGQIGADAIAAVARAAGTPVIVETPGAGHAADIALLRKLLS
jgi:deoxyribonuclease-4